MNKLKYITICSFLIAIMCVICTLSIPVGPIPMTLSTLIIMIISIWFKPKISVIVVLVYILLGICGIPVFTNFQGGLEKIISVTGGFIIAYPLFSLSISYWQTPKINDI